MDGLCKWKGVEVVSDTRDNTLKMIISATGGFTPKGSNIHFVTVFLSCVESSSLRHDL